MIPLKRERRLPSARERRASPSVQSGMNRFRWNLRLDGYTDFEGRIFWAAGNMGPLSSPWILCGATRRGWCGGSDGEFEIQIDPRIDGVTAEDLQARFDLALEIRDRVSEANEAVIRSGTSSPSR